METQFKHPLPNAQSAYIIGIISCVLTFTSLIFGLILGIIAVVEGNKAIKTYEQQPELYERKEYENAKTGKLLGWISIGLSIFFILVVFLIIIIFLSFAVHS